MRLCVWLSEQAEFLFRPSPSPAQSRPKRFGAAPGLTLRGRSSKPSPKRQFSKRRKNSSDGPLSSRSGTELFTRSGGGGDVPRHFRTISEKSRSFTFSQGIPKPGPITRPCEKTADSSFRRRSLGRHTLPAKITDRFPPERPVIFKANPRPRFPTSKNVNRRPHSGRGGNTRTLPVIRPCRRPRGESWERCPPDCCAPAPEYTTAHGRYPLRAAEPAACSRRCACGTSASV